MSELTNNRADIPAHLRSKMIRVQGQKMYLPVAARISWFRGEHPDYGIVTEIVEHDREVGWACCRSEIRTPTGFVVSSGMKTEDRKGFGDYLEKAEKGAIGRALGVLGYGTDDIGEDDGDRICDAPVNRTTRNAPPGTPRSAPKHDPLTAAKVAFFGAAKGAGYPGLTIPAGPGKATCNHAELESLFGKVFSVFDQTPIAAVITDPNAWDFVTNKLPEYGLQTDVDGPGKTNAIASGM